MNPFSWKQPVGGKSIAWKPLTVGQEIDIQMANARPELAPMRPFENLRARIIDYDGQPVCSLADLKSWDALDVEAFADEVERREAERRASIIGKAAANGPGPLIEAEAALMELRVAALGFSAAADRALAAIKVAAPLGLK